MSGENLMFIVAVILALTWSTTGFTLDVVDAEVSLSNSPHMLQRRQAGPGGQQSPPACDFVQLLTFVNTSLCYNTLVKDAFPSNNKTTPGQLAEQYCTQPCAGNFIDFVMNTWNCNMTTLKKVYRLTITRICSQTNGQRCITYPFTDISFTGCELAASPTNPMCSDECRDGIVSSVNETGCCLALEVALIDVGASAVEIDTVLNTCDVQLPAPCPLDYATQPGNGGNSGGNNGNNGANNSSPISILCFVAIFLGFCI